MASELNDMDYYAIEGMDFNAAAEDDVQLESPGNYNEIQEIYQTNRKIKTLFETNPNNESIQCTLTEFTKAYIFRFQKLKTLNVCINARTLLKDRTPKEIVQMIPSHPTIETLTIQFEWGPQGTRLPLAKAIRANNRLKQFNCHGLIFLTGNAIRTRFLSEVFQSQSIRSFKCDWKYYLLGKIVFDAIMANSTLEEIKIENTVREYWNRNHNDEYQLTDKMRERWNLIKDHLKQNRLNREANERVVNVLVPMIAYQTVSDNPFKASIFDVLPLIDAFADIAPPTKEDHAKMNRIFQPKKRKTTSDNGNVKRAKRM